jgi:hypothetical protein
MARPWADAERCTPISLYGASPFCLRCKTSADLSAGGELREAVPYLAKLKVANVLSANPDPRRWTTLGPSPLETFRVVG